MEPTSDAIPPRSSLFDRWFLLANLISAGLACLLLASGLSGDFVFDDLPNIVHNEAIRLVTLDAQSLYQAGAGFAAGGGARVLPLLTFALDYWRGNGLDPATFKATNLAIHAASTFALAWFFRQLLLRAGWSYRRAAIAAIVLATAWATHPLQVSSVLYVVQRMQTLETLFLVLALSCYLKARQTQIEGRQGRIFWILIILFWALGYACKEDAALLPAYTLAIEITVLRFQAQHPKQENLLRKGYLTLMVAGIALYATLVVPHFWYSGPYPGRDFSSYERLLTQPRALIMYLGQIIAPLPQQMPFYYDWFRASRGLLTPWTTLPCILLIIGLLLAAWRWRAHRPLFSLGVFLFLTGHFITSNVIGLELAFEHRNHFPLIGAVLALGDLFVAVMQRLNLRPQTIGVICCILLAGLGLATLTRARTWSNPLTLASKSTEYAPTSSRAWNSLCLVYYKLSGEQAGNVYFDKAIEACERGSNATYAVSPLTNLVIFKTMRGDITDTDWSRLHDRLQHVTMSAENSMALWVMVNSARDKSPLNQDSVLKVIEIMSPRMQLKPVENAALGYYILEKTNAPNRAYQFFASAVAKSSPDSRLVHELLADLEKQGHHDWAMKLGEISRLQITPGNNSNPD